MTVMMNTKPRLNDWLSGRRPRRAAERSSSRLRPVWKYLALKRFQNCIITKKVKKMPSS